ncbi:MAG: hypothetical protein B7X72_08510 [Sphingobacteriia bacterium 39-39-8]|nr:MAG: hypothetical protein B7X72_08510 [Sphingobacteriia bacterium 39-39-8]HQR94323.1 DUF5686 and carboxypeptidase regulatory-like domain-containing protein [Sediminibacterium sp.]
MQNQIFRKLLFSVLILSFVQLVQAATISGTVREANGQPLPFASVMIKGSTKGTTANAKGYYSFQVDMGKLVLVAQHIGHQTVEKQVLVGSEDIKIDFDLTLQRYDLKEVVVSSGAEDPAYAIIRKAIASREEHLKEIKRFQCEVYLKGQLQLRNYPKKFMGKTVDFEDGDTSKKKMIFLSESVVRYSVQEPLSRKTEVISSKVGGQSDGFGFANPQIISLYENVISLGRGLNPRGFVSPIANSALSFYKYHFEGTFFENGKEISRIKVTPKRKFEPLFSGYINIVEDDWRIQAVQLKLLKEQGMQLLDTLLLEQLYVPVSPKAWVIKSQVLYPSGKIFGFDFWGNFLQVYDKFDLDPKFKRKFFDNTILKFEDSANKKTMAYWDSIRPIPLVIDEQKTYKKLDSLEEVRKNPHYMDSLDKRRNKFGVMGLLLTGLNFGNTKNKSSFSINPLIRSLYYNTVEGGVLQLSMDYNKGFKGREAISISPVIRYGMANQHWNGSLAFKYTYGKKYRKNFSISGGSDVFQFNNAAPILPILNSFVTLRNEYNYMKIYEAGFFKLRFDADAGNGLNFGAEFQFQNRKPLENLPDLPRWKDYPNRDFTPNYPTEITNTNMIANKASLLTLSMRWRPGARYIEFPNQKINIGSRFSVFNASITTGIEGLLGSNVNYTKWKVSVNDNLNLKLAGRLNYNFAVAGFLNDQKAFIPDYLHFQGNQLFLASNFLNSFQLAPYYQYSNQAKFNASGHIEYHLNGLLTNKIPGFKKLNWFFVTGASALHISPDQQYLETYFGIENIFKVIRIDFVQGFEKSGSKPTGFRLSLPLLSR